MTAPPTYDLFVSYAEADHAWVEGYLLDALSQAGVHYLSEAAFTLGVPRIVEFERAIKQSRRTLLVLSPAYIIDAFNQFTDLLAQSYGLETATWPVIPLILQQTELPTRLAMLTALDVTDTAHQAEAIKQLCMTLQRSTPQPSPRPQCPYPGMVPFGEADSARFFGRAREVEELLGLLRLHPFLTVIGPSGSGKSSLVFAGLLPALMSFSQDGKMLIVSVSDKTFRRWDVDVGVWEERACHIANRNLTHAEWAQYMAKDVSYRATCPNLPLDEGTSPDAPTP